MYLITLRNNVLKASESKKALETWLSNHGWHRGDTYVVKTYNPLTGKDELFKPYHGDNYWYNTEEYDDYGHILAEIIQVDTI